MVGPPYSIESISPASGPITGNSKCTIKVRAPVLNPWLFHQASSFPSLRVPGILTPAYVPFCWPAHTSY